MMFSGIPICLEKIVKIGYPERVGKDLKKTGHKKESLTQINRKGGL